MNRNWACSWRRIGYWGQRELSGGFVVFPEAKTRALGAFLTKQPMDGVIFWHSAAVWVYADGSGYP